MIVKSFFRGLVIVVPIGLTIYFLHWIFVTLDNLVDASRFLKVTLPGLGVALAVVATTFIGLLAGNFMTRWFFKMVERFFARLPGAKLIYGAIRDLLEAFVGDQKRFDRPVLVRLGEGVEGQILGFITRDTIPFLPEEKDLVGVYFPQAYNFAGQLVLVPRGRVRAIDADSSEIMQFIVSGGVSGKRVEPTGRAVP